MLGRKSYTQEELERARGLIGAQLAVYDALVQTVNDAGSDAKSAAAVEAFEREFFNSLLLVLDRFFVHRLRVSAGKDGNPVNEVELLADSLLTNNGVMRGNNVVKYEPETAVVGVQIGDRISLNSEQFRRLSAAFFAEIAKRFM